jgi:putative ABC transport system permease protein
MNAAFLIRKGMTRNKARFVLTALSIFIAFILFGLLNAFKYAFESGIDLSEANRLVTIPRVSLSESLPASYMAQIADTDGVDRVTSFTIFDGYYQDPQNSFNQFAVDADAISAIYKTEMAITPEQLENWKKSPSGVAVARSVAEKYGWQVGSRVPLISKVWQRQDGSMVWDFDITAILDIPPSSPYAANLFFHYDYLDEGRAFRKGTVGYYVLRVTDPSAASAVAESIDARFANSYAETRTSTEKAMFEFFARQFGDIGIIVTAILGAVFFTILLVIGNSMSQSVRERARELIVMRSIGFPDKKIFSMILLEGVMLGLVGGLPAILLTWFLVQGLSAQFATVLPGMQMTAGMLLQAVALMVLLGIVSSFVPVFRITRTNIAHGLRRK